MFIRGDIACFSVGRAGVSSAAAVEQNQFCAPAVLGVVVETISNLGCKDNEGLQVVEEKKLSECFWKTPNVSHHSAFTNWS